MPGITSSLTDVVLIKQCSVCREELPVTAFYKRTTASDGLQSYCKKCADKQVEAYSKANPVMRQTNGMLCKARERAREKHLEFNIDNEYVRSLVITHCPILGIPLEWSCNRGSGNFAMAGSPSLDRIDPAKGYVKGNVWIISHRANRIKSDATHEELRLVEKAVGEAIVKSLEF
jgi:hypothetical protein